jgi:2-iminoacetate synthase ThiH
METVTGLDALASRVSRGEPLTDQDAGVLLASHDLITIGMMADEARRRLHGNRTTFVRVFDIHVDALPESLPAGLSAGEFRIVGSPASLEKACAAVAAARRLSASVPLSGFVLSELAQLDERDVYARLRAAGLDRVAYAPLEWDAVASATKLARDAGLIVDRLAIVGSEDPAPPSLLVRARELQEALGGFRVFAPLPRLLNSRMPTTGYDDVKAVAAARLLVPGIRSIQVDWALYGPKLAQVALTTGADDVDSVAAVEGGALGARRSSIEEIRSNIAAAGGEPIERDGAFETRNP